MKNDLNYVRHYIHINMPKVINSIPICILDKSKIKLMHTVFKDFQIHTILDLQIHTIL